MKTIRFFGMALVAIALSMNLASCGGDDDELTAGGGNTSTTGKTPSGVVAVDLGLPSGTKWANMNVGAASPEGYGDYFAWGETNPKDYYDWSNLKYCTGEYDPDDDGDPFMYSKYDTVDNKTELDPSDDAAYVNWGKQWRMPSKAQQDELRNECTWTWTTMNGVYGRRVTGPSGNSIFLPAAGDRDGSSLDDAGEDGCYWSRTLYREGSDGAYDLYFHSSDYDWNGGISGRCYGFSVRPVLVSE